MFIVNPQSPDEFTCENLTLNFDPGRSVDGPVTGLTPHAASSFFYAGCLPKAAFYSMFIVNPRFPAEFTYKNLTLKFDPGAPSMDRRLG